ncbi:MAG: IS1 family transposase [Sphaerochaetaceae bacterium]|nr:IS1 family transposase [Sphaerochaetaceae bacterium]
MKVLTTTCPNDQCLYHKEENLPQKGNWYSSHGTYRSRQWGKVSRFRCKGCGKTFSTRTESESKYLHEDIKLEGRLAMEWLGGSSVKSLSKKYKLTNQMVKTRINRILSRYVS